MATTDDGGAAFPSIETKEENEYRDNCWSYEGQHGMSMRDYFAGQALAGLPFNEAQGTAADRTKAAAMFAYQIADAMLAERKRGRDDSV